jgi:HD-GYP domain-containing protein (c-di-GMP phosphodiesterase class II)
MHMKSIALKPINASDFELTIGLPLLFDIYDESGGLLLSKGVVLTSERQLEHLIEKGFLKKDFNHESTQSREVSKTIYDQRNIPVLRLYNQACNDLRAAHDIFLTAQNAGSIENCIFDIFTHLKIAIENSSDIAIACMVFAQGTHDHVKHCINTAILSTLIAQAMKKPEDEIQIICAASLTMDIGLAAVTSNESKSEDANRNQLTARIDQHPELSRNILQQAGVKNQDWLCYVEQHHEMIDGSGYPLGLANEQISENSQIISLADQYLELIETRDCQQGRHPYLALREILTMQGQSIRIDLAAYLIKVLGIYPPGSVVKLQNGEVGIVTKRHKNGVDLTIQSIISPRGAILQSPVKRETEHKIFSIQEAISLSYSNIKFSMEELWGQLAAN